MTEDASRYMPYLGHLDYRSLSLRPAEPAEQPPVTRLASSRTV